MSTIYQVAKLAGVSPMTAARILAGSSQRSKKRELVLSCARQLGYVRNQQAANLRTGRTQLIGIMVPFIDNPFYTKFLQEMHDASRQRNYQTLIACSFGQADTMMGAISLFESYNVDGLVLDISEGTVDAALQRKLRQIQQRGKAVVVTGAQRHDLAYDHLYLDNRDAVAKAVRHLASRGHSSIGFVGGYEENLVIQSRVEGFKQALRAAKLTVRPEWISLGNPALGSVAPRATQFVQARQRPTAVVCTSDMIAMVVVKAAVESGLSLPKELAVVGFDDVEQAALLNPGLTTIRQPLPAMAADIVELLLARLEKPAAPIQEKRYQADLVIREST